MEKNKNRVRILISESQLKTLITKIKTIKNEDRKDGINR